MIAHYEKNPDTVGWLYMKNTVIDEAVVKVNYNDNNEYYLRRTSLGEPSTGDYSVGWYGCYFADWRCTVGARSLLSKNTVIYGHSMTDNVNAGEDYQKKFTELKRYLDIDFAKNNPYIYFSTPQSDMIWQIFAVFYTKTDFAYNTPDPSNADFLSIITEARKKSIYNYDIDVGISDNILTLSTCCYNYDGKSLGYPNDYRFVVMAKLLPADAALAETVTVEANPSIMKP